jgi:hypothetical protein
MQQHSTNYHNTFIAVADDCRAKEGEIPAAKGAEPTAAVLQFRQIIDHPYLFTSDDVLFEVYAQKNNIKKADREAAREAFFSKGQPCLRASPLTKRYGWGVHSNEDGRIALYGCETPEYKKMLANKSLKVVKAMKSSR